MAQSELNLCVKMKVLLFRLWD